MIVRLTSEGNKKLIWLRKEDLNVSKFYEEIAFSVSDFQFL